MISFALLNFSAISSVNSAPSVVKNSTHLNQKSNLCAICEKPPFPLWLQKNQKIKF
jgi:hypothetical protein